MTPKVDTFEHDIADEIRRKEANLAEIQAVSKQHSPTIENIPQKKLPWFMIVLIILLIISLLGIGGFAYYYYTNSLLPPSSQSVTIKKEDIPKVSADLTKISPTLQAQIGRFVSSVEKKDAGYILTINDYSAVFGYMTRNESMFIDELTVLFQTTEAQATTTPEVATTTLKETSTTTASSTVKKITQKPATKTTSTQPGTSTEESTLSLAPPQPPSFFSDLTLANQNMRVYKKDTSTVVYSFVGTNSLLIAKTPEDILSLKSAILR